MNIRANKQKFYATLYLSYNLISYYAIRPSKRSNQRKLPTSKQPIYEKICLSFRFEFVSSWFSAYPKRCKTSLSDVMIGLNLPTLTPILPGQIVLVAASCCCYHFSSSTVSDNPRYNMGVIAGCVNGAVARFLSGLPSCLCASMDRLQCVHPYSSVTAKYNS